MFVLTVSEDEAAVVRIFGTERVERERARLAHSEGGPVALQPAVQRITAHALAPALRITDACGRVRTGVARSIERTR